MDLVATAQVVTRADTYETGLLVQPDSRGRVTSIECVSALLDGCFLLVLSQGKGPYRVLVPRAYLTT
jgi:hypothetical protein